MSVRIILYQTRGNNPFNITARPAGSRKFVTWAGAFGKTKQNDDSAHRAGTLPAQHTTFNTLDNWAIKPPPNRKGKGPERKGYRVMAQNMYTIHSVPYIY